MSTAVLAVLSAWICFALACALARVGQAGWQPPIVASAETWQRRARYAFGLAAAICTIGGLAIDFTLQDTRLRLLALMQLGLMCAAGASDCACYRLPLPVTLSGIVLACAALAVQQIQPELLAVALLWPVAVIALNIAMTRNQMGWGDHLALIWIGLSLLLFGPLAVVLGQLLLALVWRLGQWRKQPQPIGGVWLLTAALLLAGAWGHVLANNSRASLHQPRLGVSRLAPASPQYAEQRILFVLLADAGDVVGALGFVPQRAARVAEADAAATRLSRHAAVIDALSIRDARQAAAIVRALAAALRRYDLAAIEALNAQRADLAEHLRVSVTVAGAAPKGRLIPRDP